MAALQGTDDVFEHFFEQAPIGLALADLSSRYVRVNSSYAALLGRAPEDLIGVAFASVVHPDDRDADAMRTSRLLSGEHSSVQAEQRYVTPDGGARWVLHGVTVVPDAEARAAWFAVTAQDISERRRVEHELRELTAVLSEQVVRDPLTGLANRALLEERLRAVLARDARSGDTTAVLFLDLDGFKAVNDDHGHAVGDEVLRGVAARLRRVVRPSDTVARIGGDEFVVLAESAGEEQLDALISRVRTAVEVPLRVGALDLKVGVSVGVAVSRAGETDPASLLALSDQRMYDAKRAGQPAAMAPVEMAPVDMATVDMATVDPAKQSPESKSDTAARQWRAPQRRR